jgi:hypothetical protein
MTVRSTYEYTCKATPDFPAAGGYFYLDRAYFGDSSGPFEFPANDGNAVADAASTKQWPAPTTRVAASRRVSVISVCASSVVQFRATRSRLPRAVLFFMLAGSRISCALIGKGLPVASTTVC